ncbi:hypothetical protein FRC12_007320 [Ceratobasidium sp. 428]|nr:hypothetical protein FRC12_007320 [Ceratobasidium sp. 428]
MAFELRFLLCSRSIRQTTSSDDKIPTRDSRRCRTYWTLDLDACKVLVAIDHSTFLIASLEPTRVTLNSAPLCSRAALCTIHDRRGHNSSISLVHDSPSLPCPLLSDSALTKMLSSPDAPGLDETFDQVHSLSTLDLFFLVSWFAPRRSRHPLLTKCKFHSDS